MMLSRLKPVILSWGSNVSLETQLKAPAKSVINIPQAFPSSLALLTIPSRKSMACLADSTGFGGNSSVILLILSMKYSLM